MSNETTVRMGLVYTCDDCGRDGYVEVPTFNQQFPQQIECCHCGVENTCDYSLWEISEGGETPITEVPWRLVLSILAFVVIYPLIVILLLR